ncbi:MAG: hypothetical protein AAGA25_08220 [Planctomycetota bacterium]
MPSLRPLPIRSQISYAILFSLGSILGIVGCGHRPYEEGLGLILDRSEPVHRRVQTINTIELQGAQHAEAVAAMNVLVWSDRHPLELRLVAMDRLIEEQQELFWSSANRWWSVVDDPEMADAIGVRVVRDQRKDVIPGLLRRWADGDRISVEASDRMEYQVLEQLVAPRSVHEALWRWVGGYGAHDQDTARSAWIVLSRFEDESARRRGLIEFPGSGDLWGDLQSAASVLDYLPKTREGLTWLSALRSDETQWAFLVRRKQSLSEDTARGWQVRHLGVLASLPETLLHKKEQEIWTELRENLSEAQQVPRDLPSGVSVTLQAEDEPPLVWPDLALAWSVRDAMNDPVVVQAWFEQADADLIDTGSEYGGVLTWDSDGAFLAKGFMPDRRQGDRKFFSSPALIEAMYMGLAHYHFHAQQYDNAEFAGPGRGDFEFTEKLETHALTLTFVSRDRINIDLAFPDGRLIDLGCVDRPIAD